MDVERMIGRALRPVRPGIGRYASNALDWLSAVPRTIDIEGPSFGPGLAIPSRLTIDRHGPSPSVQWSNVPEGTRSLAMLVEDADAPMRRPLVHAILWGMDPARTGLEEGAIAPSLGRAGRGDLQAGRNAIGRPGWLPISPPRAHGPHRYGFQLFALDVMPAFRWPPGRRFFLEAVRGHVVARGMLIGVYRRE